VTQRFAPTTNLPVSLNPTQDGNIRSPSSPGKTRACPFSTIATSEWWFPGQSQRSCSVTSSLFCCHNYLRLAQDLISPEISAHHFLDDRVLWNRRAAHSIHGLGIEETPLRCNRDHLSLSEDIKESAGLNQLLAGCSLTRHAVTLTLSARFHLAEIESLAVSIVARRLNRRLRLRL